MSDPLSLAALTGSALTQAIGFTYARAGAALDRRRERALPAAEVAAVEGELLPLAILEEQRTPERLKRLEHARSMLRPYLEDPGLVSPENTELLTVLAATRADLEAVYGQSFRFRGEPPATVSQGVAVKHKLGLVEGRVRGVRAGGVGDKARIRIEQESDGVASGGELTGLETDGMIG